MPRIITDYTNTATDNSVVPVPPPPATVPAPPAVPVPPAPPAPPKRVSGLPGADVTSYELQEDLGLMLKQLQYEYFCEGEHKDQDFLTAGQKALVPLIAQAASAFILAERLEGLNWIMTGIAEKLGVHKDYLNV